MTVALDDGLRDIGPGFSSTTVGMMGWPKQAVVFLGLWG